eukprot:6181596-Pleurochrysis_carterae.AAC.2
MAARKRPSPQSERTGSSRCVIMLVCDGVCGRVCACTSTRAHACVRAHRCRRVPACDMNAKALS